LNASRSLAAFAIIVDVKDDRAVAFYEGFGFRRFRLDLGARVEHHEGQFVVTHPNDANADKAFYWVALTAHAQAGNPYAPAIGGVANNLLAGGGANNQAGLVSGALADYERGLAPITSASFLNPYTTPGFGDALKRVDSDITNQVNGMFAGAGRDLSPANTAALARGLAQGEGQLVADQYNRNLTNQLGALAAGYGAANTTGGLLSQLNQLGVGNEEAGIGAASSALGVQNYSPQQLLAIEAMQRAIPVDYLKSLGAIATPIAGLGGQTNGTAATTTQVPLGNQIAGGLLGGAGLLGKLGGFGSNGWLYGGPNALL